MDIAEISKQLIDIGVIDSPISSIQSLQGGTVSSLFLIMTKIGERYVVKSNEQVIVKEEANFLETYVKLSILPKLLYVDPHYQYIVYTYIEGTTDAPLFDKKENLDVLAKELIQNYAQMDSSDEWGWADEPKPTWMAFLLERYKDAKATLKNDLTEVEHSFILNLINDAKDYTGHPHLIHGDCGFHNTIWRNNRLVGVIDPTPVFGPPIYDLVYAFCSTPYELEKETLEGKVEYYFPDISRASFCKEVLIGLYFRMSTCLKHHPEDFSLYVDAWMYWNKIWIETKA
ncbi:aminoglycoside phosphotransferase family protein [Radiobacillus deserti]|uniref:Aminoglycoside phosphotransferase family protein n=1 Tax=Radiobacillus deserti TaxID=2594883 RepID=A0A516KET7_9BACI|nr:aminoglycoside phosphotransferase family protein [Radiobacillus deserti]QDP39900.1 aminoglycoside phosphotransferase family protein [Radiobacillus deserti]